MTLGPTFLRTTLAQLDGKPMTGAEIILQIVSDATAGTCNNGFARQLNYLEKYRGTSQPLAVLELSTGWFGQHQIDLIRHEIERLFGPDAVRPAQPHDFRNGNIPEHRTCFVLPEQLLGPHASRHRHQYSRPDYLNRSM